MSGPSTKAFCVRFMAWRCYEIRLRAPSEAEALAKPRRLWATKGAKPFTCTEGETDAWDAEPE
jgi:hypothetical protein